jgi:hypothetical protein
MTVQPESKNINSFILEEYYGLLKKFSSGKILQAAEVPNPVTFATHDT